VLCNIKITERIKYKYLSVTHKILTNTQILISVIQTNFKALVKYSLLGCCNPFWQSISSSVKIRNCSFIMHHSIFAIQQNHIISPHLVQVIILVRGDDGDLTGVTPE